MTPQLAEVGQFCPHEACAFYKDVKKAQNVNEPDRIVAVRSGKDYTTNRIRNPHDPDATYGTKQFTFSSANNA